ncbi:MAG: hypothetical protein RL684_1346, partial [Pseudomonadota bacterium]
YTTLVIPPLGELRRDPQDECAQAATDR